MEFAQVASKEYQQEDITDPALTAAITLSEPQPEQQLTPDKQSLQWLSQNLNMVITKIALFEGSRKQLKQVLAALVEDPHNKEPFKFSYPEQEELYNLCLQVRNNNFVLFHVGMVQHEEAEMRKQMLVDQQASQVAEDVTNTPNENVTPVTNEGESNGQA